MLGFLTALQRHISSLTATIATWLRHPVVRSAFRAALAELLSHLLAATNAEPRRPRAA